MISIGVARVALPWTGALGLGAPAAALAQARAVVAQAPVPLTIENIERRRHGAFDAAISPDGRWVAVTADAGQGRGIYLVSTTGAPGIPPHIWARGASPSWFPDSKRIVFVRDNDLWTIAVGAAGPTRLTADSADERTPVVSPDGRLVAYYSSRSGHQDIWLFPTTGLTDDGLRAEPSRLT